MFSKFPINVSRSAILDDVTCKIRSMLNVLLRILLYSFYIKITSLCLKIRKIDFGVTPDLKRATVAGGGG